MASEMCACNLNRRDFSRSNSPVRIQTSWQLVKPILSAITEAEYWRLAHNQPQIDLSNDKRPDSRNGVGLNNSEKRENIHSFTRMAIDPFGDQRAEPKTIRLYDQAAGRFHINTLQTPLPQNVDVIALHRPLRPICDFDELK